MTCKTELNTIDKMGSKKYDSKCNILRENKITHALIEEALLLLEFISMLCWLRIRIAGKFNRAYWLTSAE